MDGIPFVQGYLTIYLKQAPGSVYIESVFTGNICTFQISFNAKEKKSFVLSTLLQLKKIKVAKGIQLKENKKNCSIKFSFQLWEQNNFQMNLSYLGGGGLNLFPCSTLIESNRLIRRSTDWLRKGNYQRRVVLPSQEQHYVVWIRRLRCRTWVSLWAHLSCQSVMLSCVCLWLFKIESCVSISVWSL